MEEEKRRRRKGQDSEESSNDEEYEVEDVREDVRESRGHHMARIASEFEAATEAYRRIYSREHIFKGLTDLSRGCSIHPDNRYGPYFYLNANHFSSLTNHSESFTIHLCYRSHDLEAFISLKDSAS